MLLGEAKIRSAVPRAPNGLPPVVKSRICVASLRCSSVSRVGRWRGPDFE